jgi:hypothetical protein
MTNAEKLQEAKRLHREDKRRILLENGWAESWDEDNWVRRDAFNTEANTGISLESAFNYEMSKKYPVEISKESFMSITGFNEKYREFLEEGHYGLDIDDKNVIQYLDEQFQEFIKIPGFTYSQVKTKFGMARFYCEPHSIDSTKVEKEINQILLNGNVTNTI